jgi:two-component system, cell cycle response regulator CpdR
MKRILIVDDQFDVAETINEMIHSYGGYDSKFVTQAKEAISLLEAEKFDLVIADLIMPEMNGIELVDYISKVHPKIKILACSGGGESGAFVAGMALDQALDEGADNALLKPFSSQELMDKIEHLFNPGR